MKMSLTIRNKMRVMKKGKLIAQKRQPLIKKVNWMKKKIKRKMIIQNLRALILKNLRKMNLRLCPKNKNRKYKSKDFRCKKLLLN